jgi:diguanylate cyclase (GGDEF)-like protein/PAS domain S-box-containing protein
MVDHSGMVPSASGSWRADAHGVTEEVGGSRFAEGSTAAHTVAMLRLAGTHPVVRGFPEGVIIVFDRELRYLAAGGDGLSTVGLTQEMIEGKTIYEVFPPGVSATLEQPYRNALLGHEATMDIPFGSRTFLHRIAPLTDDEGTIVAGIGFALDVTQARRSEAALRESAKSLLDERRRLHDAEAIGNSGSWEWDVVTNVIRWSDGLFALHGIARTSFDGGYEEAASRVHPDDRATVDEAMAACRRNESVQFRYRTLRANDAQIRWFDSRASGVFEEGRLVRLIGAVADVTEQVLAQAEVIEANVFQQAVIAASPDYTFISDVTTGAMVYGSHDRDLLGRSTEETVSLGSDSIDVLVHPDDQAALRSLDAQARSLRDGQVLQIRYRLRHADGQWHWFSRHVVPFRRDATGAVVEILGVLRDITDVVLAEEQLSHGALHDPLTGLPNRALLLDRLEAALARSAREHRDIAILFCDLDGFKQVNDSAGHAAGDAVLVQAAARLGGVLRPGDTVARVGGDEFVLVVEPWNRAHGDDSPDAEPARDQGRSFPLKVAHRVVRAFREPFTVNGAEHAISISIGIAHSSPPARGGQAAARGTTPLKASEILEEADAAMYRAKREGKNRVAVSAVSRKEEAAAR